MATEFDKKLVNGEVLGKVAQGVLNAAAAKDAALEESLQGKIDKVSGNVTTLDGKVDGIKADLEQADSLLQEAISDEADRAAGKEAELAKAISDEETRAKAAEKANADAITALEGKVGDLVGDVVQSTLTDLTNRMTAAEGDIDALEGRMDTAEGKVTALEGQMGTAQGDITQLRTDLTAESNRAKGVEGNLDKAIKDEIARATAKEGLIDNEISGLKTANANQDVSIAAAQSAADKAQGEVDVLEGVVDQLDTRLTNALSQEVSDREAAVQGVQAAVTKEVQDRKDAITSVEGKVAQAKTDLEGLIDEKIQQVNGAAEGLEARVKANEDAIAALNGEDGTLATLKSDLEKYADQAEADAKSYADTEIGKEKSRAEEQEALIRQELADAIAQEVADRNTEIGKEKSRAEGQEAAIRQEMATAIGVKAAEGQEATGLRKEIADAVAAEKQRAEGVEAAIRGEVTAAIAQEVTDRNAAIKVEADRAKEQEAAIRGEFAAADTALGGRIDGVVGRLDVIEGDATVEGSIAKAQADAEAKAQELVNGLANGQVATNKANIQTLMGGEEVEGSVDNKIKAAIDEVNGAADDLADRVKANEDNLAIVMGADTVAGSIAKAQKDAQAYADQQITALVDSAPDAMNTLNELATAINNNKSTYDAYVSQHAEAMAAMKKELQDEIDADVKVEADRALAAEAAIRGEFAAADTALHKTISAEIDADVKAEKDRAEGQEALIRQELAEEKAALQKEIDDDVAAEKALREAADKAMADRLDALEGDGEGSVKAAVEEVANALANQMNPDVEGSLADQIDDEKTRAEAKELEIQNNVNGLRQDVVTTFNALKLQFNADGTAQVALTSNQMDGEVTTPIGAAVEIPVMSDADVQALIGSLQ